MSIFNLLDYFPHYEPNPVLRGLIDPTVVAGLIEVPQLQSCEPARGVNVPQFSLYDRGRIVGIPLRYDIPDGIQIVQILHELVQRYARLPEIHERAAKIVLGLADDDQLSQIYRLSNFVRDHVQFLRDPHLGEYIISPLVMLDKIAASGKATGDCDDHVLLLNSLAQSIGFPTRVVGVKANSDLYNHVLSSIYFRNKWVDIDSTIKIGEQPVYAECVVSV